ncbi:MAG: ATP-binding cassette domain-containing protein [Clostridiales bacterium]|nr:ATP-binding cassette domain-containing protein [Clostridiales bacterium]
MLNIRGLSYSVETDKGTQSILKNVDLDIDSGRFVVITGPNGSGKTTLAKAIMGLIKPDSGTISYNGADITGLSVTERAKLGISYGFQQPPRFKGLLVTDLLSIAAGRDMQEGEYCSYLTQVGLCTSDYLGREIDAALSGGELKRIEIATILARGASLMIFDEPEAGIDLWSFTRLTDTFRSIHQNTGATIIIISHQERIIRLADELVLISGGEITQRGSVESVLPQILDDTVPECAYIGEAAI